MLPAIGNNNGDVFVIRRRPADYIIAIVQLTKLNKMNKSREIRLASVSRASVRAVDDGGRMRILRRHHPAVCRSSLAGLRRPVDLLTRILHRPGYR